MRRPLIELPLKEEQGARAPVPIRRFAKQNIARKASDSTCNSVIGRETDKGWRSARKAHQVFPVPGGCTTAIQCPGPWAKVVEMKAITSAWSPRAGGRRDGISAASTCRSAACKRYCSSNCNQKDQKTSIVCMCASYAHGGAHLGMLAVLLAVDGCVEGVSSDNPRLPVSHG